MELRVRPEDIDRVRVGQQARVRFSALDLIYMPPFDATVEYRSADKIPDEQQRSGKTQHFYMVRLSDIAFPPNFTKDRIYPGMPVETFILTEERTFFGYLLRPIRETLDRSLRER